MTKQLKTTLFFIVALLVFALSMTCGLQAWALESSVLTETGNIKTVSTQENASSEQQDEMAVQSQSVTPANGSTPATDSNVDNPDKDTQTSSNKNATNGQINAEDSGTVSPKETPTPQDATSQPAGDNTKNEANTTPASPGTDTATSDKSQQTPSPSKSASDLKLNGWYKIAALGNTSYVLDVKGGKTAEGTNVQLYRSNHSLAQFFSFTYSNGYYRIVNARAQKALDAEKGKKINGTNVAVRSKNSVFDSQLFEIRKNDDGTYTFINKANGLALDIAGNSLRNGANIQTYAANGSSAQRFMLIAVQNILGDGLITIQPVYTSRVLDVKGAKTANNTNVQLYAGNETLAQKWYVRALGNPGNNTYRFQSVVSNKYLGLSGRNVVIKPSNSTDKTQQWIASINGGGITLKNASSGLMLDITGAGNKNGTNVQTYQANNTNAQRFILNATIPLKNGMYTIATALKSSMLLEIAGGSSNNRANARIYKNNNSNAQKWNVTRNNDGTYTITNVQSKKVLDVVNAVMANRTNVQQYAKNNSIAQKWRIFYDNGIQIVAAKNNEYVLDVSGARTGNATNVQLYKDNNTAAQKWIVTPTTRTKSKVELMSAEQRRMYYTAQKYSSPNSWLVIVDRNTNRMGVFRGSKGNWDYTRFVKCTTGKSSTPTPRGEYKIIDRKPSFGSGYTCWYATRFRMNGYYFHSVLYKQGSKTKLIDGRLGQNLSHGCVRLALNDARWVYQTIPNKSRVIVL